MTAPLTPPPVYHGTTKSEQKICTECGAPFMSRSPRSKVCSEPKGRCAMRRQRRKKRDGEAFTEYATEFGGVPEAMDNATSQALQRLPEAAFETLKAELAPVVREKLTGDVLRGIGDMVGLLALTQDALKESLTAVRLVTDADGNPVIASDGEPMFVPDSAERMKAAGYVLKYTLGQSGLAPQPEAPEMAPITVVFPTMPAPPNHIDGDEPVELAELPEGHRECDICAETKPAAEFVGSSSRCQLCHDANRARAEAAIAARTKPAT